MYSQFLRSVGLGAITISLLFYGLDGSCEQIKENSLYAKISRLLISHSTVKAGGKDIKAALERVEASKAGWYPQLNITSHYGKEFQDNFTGDNTKLVTREFNINVTQLLWDFGITNNTIKTAELQVKLAEVQSELNKSDLLLRALISYANVKRSYMVNQFALRSEENIKKQASLEDAMVEKGAGVSTNVLQAKVTLAGAQARRVQTQGALNIALNSYYTLFREYPKDLYMIEKLHLPLNFLPASIEHAISISFIENINIKAASIGINLSETLVDINTSQGFLPIFQLTGDAKYKKEVGGTVGFEKEYLGKLQFTYPFNLGLTAINTLKASEYDVESALLRISNLKDQIEEQVRNSWVNYQTSIQNFKLLKNQAAIASEFLELARKERQLGKRELIEVLAGETNLINAQSDSVSAETDVVIAGLTLLSIMGRLDLEMVPNLIGKSIVLNR